MYVGRIFDRTACTAIAFVAWSDRDPALENRGSRMRLTARRKLDIVTEDRTEYMDRYGVWRVRGRQPIESREEWPSG